MADPTFSVVTVAFQAAEALRKTAASVLRQEASFEYIIFDNCSTDGTEALARKLKREANGKLRFRSEADLGIFDAMNKGIRAARGRYLIFLGAGDTLEPGILRRVEKYLPPHDRGFIYGDFKCEGVHYGERFTNRRMCFHNICHQAIFYGREIFQLCGEYPLAYPRYADWAFNLSCFGRRDIKKIRLRLTVARIAKPGASSIGDPKFHRDRWRLVVSEYGRLGYWQIRFVQPAFPFIRWWEVQGELRERLRGFGLPFRAKKGAAESVFDCQNPTGLGKTSGYEAPHYL